MGCSFPVGAQLTWCNAPDRGAQHKHSKYKLVTSNRVSVIVFMQPAPRAPHLTVVQTVSHEASLYTPHGRAAVVHALGLGLSRGLAVPERSAQSLPFTSCAPLWVINP